MRVSETNAGAVPTPEQSDLEQRLRPLVRATLHQIRPYVPGRPIADVAREFGLTEGIVKLASNENPLGPSPAAQEAVLRMVTELHRYPDGAAQDLRGAIASHIGLTPAHIFVGNGSDEIIKMISETFLSPGDEVVAPHPSFGQYAFGAHLMGARVVQVPFGDDFSYDVDAFARAVTPRTKLLYLCTPNNPTGVHLTHSEVDSLLRRLRDDIIVILDEAYLEYVDAPDPVDSRVWVRAGRPVISLRTFSKMYGLAGLRLGYGVADPALVRFLHQVREPFNANAVAQAAAAAALGDTAYVERVRAANAAGKEQYYRGLEALGAHAVRSQANFVLARVGDGEAVFAALLRRGVIVRAGFPTLDAFIRISVGTEAENSRCLAALQEVLASVSATGGRTQ